MECSDARKLVNKSVDGLTDPQERALLDQHLCECSRCAEELADLTGLDCALTKALPLQETLGDGFAARVARRLPARASRLPSLKEAFTMSRLKYTVTAVAVIALAIAYLAAPRSPGNEALAAVQTAMEKVKSLHYKSYHLPSRQPASEHWSTPTATKSVGQGGGWAITRDGVESLYLPLHKALLICPVPESDVGAMFDRTVDPRHFADRHEGWSASEKVQEVVVDGKSMLKIEIEWKRTKEPSEESVRICKRWEKAMTEIASPRNQSQGKPTFRRANGEPLKFVVTVDPSTDLVQSMEYCYQRPASMRRDHGKPVVESYEWLPVIKVDSIDYNVDIPEGFFDVKTPPGTKVYDLRKEFGADKNTAP